MAVWTSAPADKRVFEDGGEEGWETIMRIVLITSTSSVPIRMKGEEKSYRRPLSDVFRPLPRYSKLIIRA